VWEAGLLIKKGVITGMLVTGDVMCSVIFSPV